MIKVNKKEICRLFEINQVTCLRWVKKGMPRMDDGYFDLKECFKWKYKEDWKYFYQKAVGVKV